MVDWDCQSYKDNRMQPPAHDPLCHQYPWVFWKDDYLACIPVVLHRIFIEWLSAHPFLGHSCYAVHFHVSTIYHVILIISLYVCLFVCLFVCMCVCVCVCVSNFTFYPFKSLQYPFNYKKLGPQWHHHRRDIVGGQTTNISIISNRLDEFFDILWY